MTKTDYTKMETKLASWIDRRLPVLCFYPEEFSKARISWDEVLKWMKENVDVQSICDV